MKINEGKILLLLSGILVGIFVAAFIVNKTLNPTTFLSYKDYEQKSLDADQLKVEVKGINKEINRLDNKLSTYDNSDNRKETITDTLRKELDDLKITYGAEAVEGPGIILTINDRHKKQYLNSNDILFSTTHDEDLYLVVKDLRDAGAEAISINGKRIIESTAITCEGPVIMINGQYIVPPFVISAIGDTEALNYALTTKEYSSYKNLQIRELELKISKENRLVINGIDNISTPKYAKPIQ
jgi:uncharacterized protein YlxW (UPF0749 family)